MRRPGTASLLACALAAYIHVGDTFSTRPPNAASWRPGRASELRQARSIACYAAAASVEAEEPTEKPLVRVRFVNTPEGKDILAIAKEGENLMKVGDKAGLTLPRACCTGLCGTCTSDLMDPTFVWKAGSKPSGAREGWQTVRACSTMVKVPPGCEEMVVDVYRMRKKGKTKGAVETVENPMERFSGDWELDFRKGSKWAGTDGTKDGMALRQARPDDGSICTTCQGSGRVPCFNCKGKGQIVSGTRSLSCYLCKGEGLWYCADCQATGMIRRKKP